LWLWAGGSCRRRVVLYIRWPGDESLAAIVVIWNKFTAQTAAQQTSYGRTEVNRPWSRFSTAIQPTSTAADRGDVPDVPVTLWPIRALSVVRMT
jgi:hypothetical protein